MFYIWPMWLYIVNKQANTLPMLLDSLFYRSVVQLLHVILACWAQWIQLSRLSSTATRFSRPPLKMKPERHLSGMRRSRFQWKTCLQRLPTTCKTRMMEHTHLSQRAAPFWSASSVMMSAKTINTISILRSAMLVWSGLNQLGRTSKQPKQES